MNLIFKETLWSFFISMIPVVELRGALPYALAHNINPLIAVPLCVFGNLLPTPFILLFIRQIFTYLKKIDKIRIIIQKLEEKAFKKSKNVIKYNFWGLMLFVAIPLPGTGAWTGALIAALLDMRFKYAMPAILLGLLIASAIVTTVYFLIASGVAPFLGWILG